MSKAYRIKSDGSTAPMKRIRTRDEDKELQQVLERNPDLLPGEQIDQEDPCRWLVVGREMKVPDPETGTDRWNLDLFFVDHNAKPTLIECKRFRDTRARREVVAQMLDYAANANHYWSKEDLRATAESTANAYGESLESLLTGLTDDEPDQFFQRVEDNLREGQIRMVFFLEEAPWQLRSIVEFLNRQMERSEVLIVEARQYEDGDSRIVVPSLFGYTEEARRVKRTVTVTSQTRKKWDDESFRQAVSDRLDQESTQSMIDLYEFLNDLAPERKFGSSINGSVSFYWPDLCQQALFSLYGDGALLLPFGVMNGNEAVERARDELYDALTSSLHFEIKEDYEKRYPHFYAAEWGPRIEELKAIIKKVVPTSLTKQSD
jgi:hypothetical protein